MDTSNLKLTAKDRRTLAISELLLLMLGVIGLAVVVWAAWLRPSGLHSYADCAAAGNPVQDSYPSVCVTEGGQRFVNPDEHVSQLPSNGKRYMTIQQWQVRLPLTAAISDGYYEFNDSQGNAYVTTKKLEAAVDSIKGCKSGLHGIYVERVLPGDSRPAGEGPPWTEDELKTSGAVPVGAYFYREQSPIETACVTKPNEPGARIASDLQGELRRALPNLQSVE
jgi:hypothetical protein